MRMEIFSVIAVRGNGELKEKAVFLCLLVKQAEAPESGSRVTVSRVTVIADLCLKFSRCLSSQYVVGTKSTSFFFVRKKF